MGKTIIVTAGPTNERIDAVMKITNMSTGALGSEIASTLLEEGSIYADQVDKIYYISTKLSRKPAAPYDQVHKIHDVRVESTDDLLNTLRTLLTNPNEHIDAVVHSAAVGDYKGRYAARAEDIAEEIAKTIMNAPYGAGTSNKVAIRDAVQGVLEHPACVQNDATKISSYEPNLMVMLDLTPKVISSIKQFSPDTMLIGFKLLEGVSEEELFNVASTLRRKNKADFIVANDLSKIGNGKHPAMIIGTNGDGGTDTVTVRCETKADIAQAIARLIFPEQPAQEFEQLSLLEEG